MPKSTQTSTSFHLFPTLPSELRLKIWQHSCFDRILTLTYSSSNDKLHCTSPPPAILSVSKEAREEALRVYSLCFATRNQPAIIYYNPYRDTLYLPRHGEMGYDETLRDFRDLVQDEGLLDETRCVAIDHVNLNIKRPWESYNKASLLRGFKNLDEVTLVMSKNEELGIESEVDFEDAKEDPERLLRIWYYFRQSFLAEEKLLEDVCRETGRQYTPFSLPTVRIKSRALKRRQPAGIEDIQAALERTWL